MSKAMTSGSPAKHILSFAVPLFFGLLFQQLYNLADSAIVGRLLGSDSLAAVGSTGSIIFMLIGFCTGLCSGFAIPVAQSFGAGDIERMRRYIGTSVWLAAAASIFMTIGTMLLCRPILQWMHTPEAIQDQAYDYLIIIFAAIPTTILYNLLSGYLRSLGSSKTSLYFLLLSSAINVILDLTLIRYFGCGVEAAAWATLISQAVSGIGCLVYIVKRCEEMHLNREHLRFRKDCAAKLCYAGVPMGLQYTVTAVGSVILQTFLNGLGTACVAASAAGVKICNLLACPFDALGSTMATYCGQNAGAGKYSRIGSGIRSAGIIGSVYGIAAFLLMLRFSGTFAMLFLDGSEKEILAYASRYIQIQTAFYIPLLFVNVLRFSIQGMGFSVLAISAGVMELIARACAGFFLVPALGYTGACLGSPLAWILADLFLVPACVGCIRHLAAVGPAESAQSEEHRKHSAISAAKVNHAHA